MDWNMKNLHNIHLEAVKNQEYLNVYVNGHLRIKSDQMTYWINQENMYWI